MRWPREADCATRLATFMILRGRRMRSRRISHDQLAHETPILHDAGAPIAAFLLTGSIAPPISSSWAEATGERAPWALPPAHLLDEEEDEPEE
jgi:hypothetical protein